MKMGPAVVPEHSYEKLDMRSPDTHCWQISCELALQDVL